MMQEVKLAVSKRQAVGKGLGELRSQGLVPGVVYGQGSEALAVQVEAKTLDKSFHQAGTSKLLEVILEDDKPVNALFHEVQTDPVTRQILHFDLYKVRMDETIRTEVPIHFEGESPAVYNLNGMLLKPLESLEIEALPKDLPEHITVDLTKLTDIGQEVFVKDLAIPAGVEVFNEPETRVAYIEEQVEAQVEEEEAEDLAAAEAAAVEGVGSEHGAETPEGEEGATEGSEAPKAKPEE